MVSGKLFLNLFVWLSSDEEQQIFDVKHIPGLYGWVV